jgi:intracellular septation protein A
VLSRTPSVYEPLRCPVPLVERTLHRKCLAFFMKDTISLWWSLFWRLGALIVVLSFVLSSLAQLFFPLDDATFIFWRPTALFWLCAAVFWLLGAASPRFLTALVWGERVPLSPIGWLAVARALSVFFLLLGIINLGVWKLGSTESWVTFKVLAPIPLFALFLAGICTWLRRSNAVT